MPSIAGSSTQLRIGPEYTRLEGGAANAEGAAIAPGSERLVREHFLSHASPAMALESAIIAIEDELARVPRSLHRAALASSDPALHAIARAAGLDGAEAILHRGAVEPLFARLAAVAGGRPATFESLPEDPRFAAALLLVRELMHHLDIVAISLEPPGTREPAR